MNKEICQHITGCILGTAVGDAVGLRREGLSATRAKKLYGTQYAPDLLFGRGYVSDDTEHTVIVARSLLAAGGDPESFQRHLCSDLKRWLLVCPAGVGFATLRAVARLWLGYRASRSGVWSAGNGPAMRSALLGICADSDEHLRELVQASSRITHTDPRAEQGALAVALAARYGLEQRDRPKPEIVAEVTGQIEGDELVSHLHKAAEALRKDWTPEQYARDLGWDGFVSGYVNQTVPAAIYCWAASTSFRDAVENAVGLGGDMDSVAAITGAISGTELGDSAIPTEWLDRLHEWPRDVRWMRTLSSKLSSSPSESSTVPSMRWGRTAIRNAIFACVVLGIGFRRILPPY